MADLLTPEQIAEHEAQLEGIEQLLAASPEDASLLALKRDLLELIRLSKASHSSAPPPSTSAAADGDAATGDSQDLDLPLPPPPPPPALQDAAEAAVEAGVAAAAGASADTSPDSNGGVGEDASKKKKKQKIKDFVVPPHLIVQDTDSEAERNRKRRALKALKNKWREKKKEVESDNKKKSWQTFQKKTKRKDANSIFATHEGVNDRVGVISKKTMTEFGARKRHKGS